MTLYQYINSKDHSGLVKGSIDKFREAVRQAHSNGRSLVQEDLDSLWISNVEYERNKPTTNTPSVKELRTEWCKLKGYNYIDFETLEQAEEYILFLEKKLNLTIS